MKAKRKKKTIPKISERRRFIRHSLCMPLKYSVVGKGTVEKGTATMNVSCGGLLFSAKKSVAEDSMIVIKLPVQDKIFNIKAKVVHCQKNLETKLYNIGVSFLKITDAFKVKLIEQIYLIIEYRSLRSLEVGKDISLHEASKEWIKRYSKRFEKLYW